MGEIVGYKVRDRVAIITVDNPPINALSHPVRARLLKRVQQAAADPGVGALVIRAEGKTFPAGADARDYRTRVEGPTLAEVCQAIEDCPKPVIAAIHGTALGGGFELALACHFRLVHIDAQMGLPDVALGAVPAAGATQRLPRVIGASKALDMLVSGRPISAEGAARIGLSERTILKNLDRAAFGSARNLVSGAIEPRPTRERREGLGDPKAYLDAVEERRKALGSDAREAVHRVVDLVEAALLLPFDAGLEMERAAFEDLVESDQAQGLRHAFLAERRTVREEGLDPSHARKLGKIGVVGDRRLAVEIVRILIAAGRQVALYAPEAETVAALRDRIEASLGRDVAAGRLAASRRDEQLARLVASHSPADLADSTFVIEALEAANDEVRRAVFALLGEVTAPGTAIATATAASSRALADRANASEQTDDVIGLRFSEPVHRSRLVEILRRPGADDALAATAVALARAVGKVPVLPARPSAGIASALLGAFWQAACWLVEEGASPLDVDAALTGYGFAEGPFEMLDRIGMDRLPVPEGAAGELVVRMRAQGWTGSTASHGFRMHGAGADPAALASGVADLIDTLRRDRAIAPRTVGAEEIVSRCLGALVNTGAALLADGTAARPADIDVVMLAGYGFPRWRGGPMEAADLTGLLQLRNRLRDWAEGRDGAHWQPHPLFDELIKNGRRFDSLNV